MERKVTGCDAANAVIKRVDELIPLKPLVLDEIPVFTAEDYLERINLLLELGEREGATHLVVYGDREHYSNMEYLTGYDPRFEESLLVLSRGKKPMIILGNEGMDYAENIPYDIQMEQYSTFSLSGQFRKKVDMIKLFEDAGINSSSCVGVIGWKIFTELDFESYRTTFDLPYFIVKLLEEAAGESNLFNASHLMTGHEGVRHQLSAKELILCEIAGTKASRNTLRVLQNLKPGISELEASGYLQIDGAPLSTHPNINFGTHNVCLGLASPTQNKKLEVGENISVGMAYRRALIHKAGVYANNAEELSQEYASAVENQFKDYFCAVAKWYETVAVGVTGGEVYDAVEGVLGDFAKYGIGLNPGHLSHTDEWTNSMFNKGNSAKIKSGLSLQCDIIAVLPKPKLFIHAEDSLVVGDAKMREEIKMLAPAAWERIATRQKFMREVLKINIPDDIIPTSDLQGVFWPYMADLNTIYTMK